MKFFFTLAISVFSFQCYAQNVAAEYQMTGIGSKTYLSKMFYKNGNIRTEVNMPIGNKTMNNVVLRLKSQPNVSILLNEMNKTYTEATASSKSANANNYVITVLGNEKVGKYNTTHIRTINNGKSWESWFCKDLPSVDYPMDNNQDVRKMANDYKAKGISGMMVKLVFNKPGTTTPTMTMLLTKYENKTLASSLFEIPAGYTKSTVNFDAEKMKNMTPAEKQEMIQKMIKANTPK